MKFINPKTDFAFKKIFGSEQSQDMKFLSYTFLDARGSKTRFLRQYLSKKRRLLEETGFFGLSPIKIIVSHKSQRKRA